MKAQPKITARCGEKLYSSARLRSTIGQQKANRAAGRPVSEVQAQNEFTFAEHLRVQQEIKKRAHRFWSANGCATNNALDNWLKAENEVLTEFAEARNQSRPMRPASLFRLAALF